MCVMRGRGWVRNRVSGHVRLSDQLLVEEHKKMCCDRVGEKAD